MRLINIQLHEDGGTCEACGHEIKWHYTIRQDDGGLITVGSDCAQTLLNKEDADVLKKRARLAAQEWRARFPMPAQGEIREDYINRRIAEKAHAMQAWQMCNTYLRKSAPYGQMHIACEYKLSSEFGIERPTMTSHVRAGLYGHDNDSTYLCTLCNEYKHALLDVYRWQVGIAGNMILADVERATCSNRYDWYNKTPWQVKKV